MSRLIVFLGAVAMVLLVAAAFCWDCVRIELSYRQQAATVEQQLAQQEQRLLAAVESWPNLPADVAGALTTYKTANAATRHEAFAELQTATQKSLLATLDATQPAARRVIDEVQGALNRRDVVLKQSGDQLAEQAAWSRTIRSSVGRMFLRG